MWCKQSCLTDTRPEAPEQVTTAGCQTIEEKEWRSYWSSENLFQIQMHDPVYMFRCSISFRKPNSPSIQNDLSIYNQNSAVVSFFFVLFCLNSDPLLLNNHIPAACEVSSHEGAHLSAEEQSEDYTSMYV